MATFICKPRGHIALAALAVSLGLSAAPTNAQYQVLYSFKGVGGDGATPVGSLTPSGNVLYGFTHGGGNAGFLGTIFKYDLSSGNEIASHAFQGGASDGELPFGSPTLSGNALYGMSGSGIIGTSGVVYQYNVATNAASILHAFPSISSSDGAQPSGSLILSGNTLYGVTQQGGSSGLFGTIFQYNLATSTETLLHSFTNPSSDGNDPIGSLTQAGNTLYGMTEAGGGPNGGGTIYRYNISSGAESIVYSFGNKTGDGISPFGSLILSGNNLYGMTLDGGSNGDGAVFQYNLSTGAETILHSFAGGTADGASPVGGLTLVGDTLYGMTGHGGIGGTSGAGSDVTGNGVIFSYDLDAAGYSIVHNFAGSLSDGANPSGDLTLVGNTLYGMTPSAGAHSDGTIFSLTVSSVPEPASCGLLAAGALARRRRRA